MQTETLLETLLLDKIIDTLDIPKSYYDKAVARHKSLGEWLCRPDSKVVAFQPHVSPQGSFRYGTVNRPLRATDEYDLDNVTTLAIAKTAMTQRQLKQLYGEEVKGYARAHGIISPVEEKNRCWRLVYSDEISFHLDTVPCVPENAATIASLIANGVPVALASRAVAITDRRHPLYAQITDSLLSSNPRGFARWFEERAKPVAADRLRRLVESRLYASVEDVPPYEWKTPLQRSIQILKRLRDVMFLDNPELSPISMIITNLAANAYQGEEDIWLALTNIIERMPQYVRTKQPFVPNPTDPREDYADRWSTNPALQDNFWMWHTQVKADMRRLPANLLSDRLTSEVKKTFAIDLADKDLADLGLPKGTPIVVTSASPVQISSAPRPWGE